MQRVGFPYLLSLLLAGERAPPPPTLPHLSPSSLSELWSERESVRGAGSLAWPGEETRCSMRTPLMDIRAAGSQEHPSGDDLVLWQPLNNKGPSFIIQRILN